MTTEELILKYPKVPGNILRQYEVADSILIVNDNDKDLVPIEIPLPEQPEPYVIDNFGLPKKDQKIHKSYISQKLKDLDYKFKDSRRETSKKNRWTLDDVWHFLKINSEDYKEDIEFIRQEQDRIRNGYWVYINGKATYLDGIHYFYLNYWHLDDILPEYRSRDRKWFLFNKFCMADPYCFGFAYPKHRREGATSRAQCVNYWMLMMNRKINTGIQSMTDKHAGTVFSKNLVNPWKELPFFMLLSWDGADDPKSRILFSGQSKGVYREAETVKPTRNEANFMPSLVGAYDTWKLHYYHQDEVAKTKDIDINVRWQVVMQCLTQGPIIHGHSIATSTVGEFEKGGGKNFFTMISDSNYHERDSETGRTRSGLYTLFISAEDGLEGFVDEYGNSVITSPTEVQKEYLKKKNPELSRIYDKGLGSREYKELIRKSLKEKSPSKYAEEVRMYPMQLRECFRGANKDSGFNLAKIEDRLEHLRFDTDESVVKGNFVFTTGDKTNVVFQKDEVNGRFVVSHLLRPNESCQKFYDHESGWIPMNPKFSAGSDPYSFRDTEGNRRSDGGGAVFWKRDFSVDHDSKPVSEWKSHRFVCTYSYRPESKIIYCEDMLAMCVYYGATMWPETDIPLIWDYFIDQGFGGYLLYQYVNGVQKVTPGSKASPIIKQQMFDAYMNYIEHHVVREKHVDLMEQMKDIGGPKDLTDYDMFAAGGYALLGAQSIYSSNELEDEDTVDIMDYL